MQAWAMQRQQGTSSGRPAQYSITHQLTSAGDSSSDMHRTGSRSPKDRDSIPLVEYPRDARTDALHKIHAHSSAETSGLGDSLQRIHTLSSTETSGIGETAPSPNGLTSPTYELHGAASTAAPVPATRPEQTIGGQLEMEGARVPAKTCLPGRAVRAGSAGDASRYVDDPGNYKYMETQEFDDLYNQSPHSGSPYKNSHPYAPQHRGSTPTTDQEVALYMDLDGRLSISSNDIALCAHGNSLNTQQSTWMKWSQDRKNSFKKRLDSIEQRQKDMEKARVPTPVKKARKESVVFVSPALEAQVLDDAELQSSLPVIPAFIPRRRLDRNAPGRNAKLTVHQWNTLTAFWDHDVFVKFRYVGMLFSLVAMPAGFASLASSDWESYEDLKTNQSAHRGLWVSCASDNKNVMQCKLSTGRASDVGVWDTCYVIKPVNHVSKCLATKPHWQNAVIGLMIFAVAFGFLALVLSVFGLCTATLPRKIYYYHSAGEIYFICAFSSTAALIVYPVALATNQETSTDHSYGYGYWLGWGSASFFLLAALCMCLDDLFRTITRGLCCHGGDRSADARV